MCIRDSHNTFEVPEFDTYRIIYAKLRPGTFETVEHPVHRLTDIVVERTDDSVTLLLLGQERGLQQLFDLATPPVHISRPGDTERSHEDPQHRQTDSDRHPNIQRNATKRAVETGYVLLDFHHSVHRPRTVENRDVELDQLTPRSVSLMGRIRQVRDLGPHSAAERDLGKVGKVEAPPNQLRKVRKHDRPIRTPHLHPHLS